MEVSAVTGSSGSAASPSDTTHHTTRANDLCAFKMLAHQHEGEIRRTLAEQGTALDFAFVPHSVPLVRGIFATLFFRASICGRPLNSAAKSGCSTAPLCVAAVAGRSFSDIAVSAFGGSACALAVIDNLFKGVDG